MQLSKLLLLLSKVLFLSIILIVYYVLFSLIFGKIIHPTIFNYPELIALLPVMFLVNMYNLFYVCDYESNVNYIVGIVNKKSFNFLLYSSVCLLNPLILFVYTKSYNCFFRPWGIIRCFPIINIMLYKRLVNNEVLKSNKTISANKLILLYIKGKLLYAIITKKF
jgi:hypothetical protein